MNDSPEIQATLCTELNMGDHAERVRIAHNVWPGETVEHLLMRLMEQGSWRQRYRQSKPASDWIEIRYVEGTAPDDDMPEYEFATKGAPF